MIEILVQGAEKMLGELRIASEELSKMTGVKSSASQEVKPLRGSILRPRVRLREKEEDVEWAQENQDIQKILDMVDDAASRL